MLPQPDTLGEARMTGTTVVSTTRHTPIKLNAATYYLSVTSSGTIDLLGAGVAGVSATGTKAVRVTNAGEILGGAGAGTTAAGGDGVNFDVAGTIRNTGLIGGGAGRGGKAYGGGGGAGIELQLGGTIINAGTIAGGNGGSGTSAGGGAGGGIVLLAGGSVMNTGTVMAGTGYKGPVFGLYGEGAGIYADAGANITNNGLVLGSSTTGAAGRAGVGVGGTVNTLTNNGIIEGGTGSYSGGLGVGLQSGKIVNNGKIEGGESNGDGRGGNAVTGTGATTILNHGSIIGGNSTYATTATFYSSPAGGGVFLGTSGAITNYGSTATGLPAGLIIGGNAGTATNYGGLGGDGVLGHGLDTVTNFGTISGGTGGASTTLTGGGGGVGIDVDQSLVINGQSGAAAGVILGGNGGQGQFGGNGGYGIFAAQRSTVMNTGTVRGGIGGSGTSSQPGRGGVGIFLAGGALYNTGVIAGGNGGVFTGSGTATSNGGIGVTIRFGTITNAGTIMGGQGTTATNGTLTTGSFAAAVSFMSDGAATLAIDPGAVFDGKVLGSASDTIVLAAGSSGLTGTLTGLGSEYSGFLSVTEQMGADWVLTSASAFEGTITVDGSLSLYGSLGKNASIIFNNGNYGATLSGGTIYGVVAGESVTVEGSTTLAASATLETNNIVDASTLALAAEVSFSNASTLTFADNTGPGAARQAAGAISFLGTSGNKFTNTGMITDQAGVNAVVGIALNNSGMVMLSSGSTGYYTSLSFSNSVTNSGTILCGTSTSLNFGAAAIIGGAISSLGGVTLNQGSTLLSGATVEAVTLMLQKNLSLAGNAQVTIGNELSLAGAASFISGRGDLLSIYALQPAGAAPPPGTQTVSISGAGSLVIAIGGTLSVAGNEGVSTSAGFVNHGTLVDSTYLSLRGSVASTGLLSIAPNATLDFYAGASSIHQTLSGAVSGSGLVRVDGYVTCNGNTTLSTVGGIVNTAEIMVAAGVTLQTSSGITLTSGGALPAIDRGHRVNPNIVVGGGGQFINTATLDVTNVSTATIGSAPGGAMTTGVFINEGTINAYGATLAITAAMLNSGTLNALGGVVTATGVISGTGVLNIGAAGTLQLHAGVTSTQTVDFGSVSGGTLGIDLAQPIQFKGLIRDFAGSDVITVDALTSGHSFVNNVLTLTESGKAVAALDFYAGNQISAANFSITSSGSLTTIRFYKP
jgi:hypothetical protein